MNIPFLSRTRARLRDGALSAVAARVVAWLGPAAGAVRGYLRPEELVKVVVMAVAAGGGVSGLVAALAAAAPSLVVNPSDAGVTAAGITFLYELIRRFAQGSGPILPGPPAAPASASADPDAGPVILSPDGPLLDNAA